MPRIRPLLIQLMFAAFFVIRLAAQAMPVPAMNVSGVVRDSSGAVVRGAMVQVESGAFRASAQTDAQGQFVIAGVPRGAGTIEVTAEGFLAARQSFAAAKLTTATGPVGTLARFTWRSP